MAACLPFVTRDFWKNLSIPKVALPLVGTALLIAFQHLLVYHAYLSQSLLPALYLCWAILLTTLATWLGAQLGTAYVLRMFAWFVLCGGILHALLGIAQYLDQPGYLGMWIDYNPAGNLSGNLAQSNHYATQVTLAAVALIYLFALGHLSLSLALPLITLLVFVLTLSAARSVLLYSGCVFLLSALGYRRTRETVHMRFTIMSALLLILFVLAQFLLPPFTKWLHEIMVELGLRVGESRLLTALERMQLAGGIELRVTEWHKALLMFLQSPIWGVGVGNYGWFSFNYQALPEFATVTKPTLFHHSHNLFTQVAAETGATGLLLLIALLFGWCKQYLLSWKVPANWFIGACLLVLLIHSNLEYPLWYSYFLGIGAFLLGAGDKRLVIVKFTPQLGQLAAGVTLALVGAILAVTFVGYRTITQANDLVYRTSPETAARAIQSVSRNVLLAPWAEQILATHGIADKSAIAKQLALTTRVVLHHPDPNKVQRQITYLALGGRTNDAIVLLNTAALAYPTHLPDYVCIWRDMPEETIRPIANYAERVLNVLPSCSPSNRELAETGSVGARRLHLQ